MSDDSHWEEQAREQRDNEHEPPAVTPRSYPTYPTSALRRRARFLDRTIGRR